MTMPNASIGMMVHWFSHADKRNTPVAAIVTATNGMGVLALARIGYNHESLSPVTAVRHISDSAYFQDHHDVMEARGGWDFMVEDRTPIFTDKVDTLPSQPPLPHTDVESAAEILKAKRLKNLEKARAARNQLQK
jgi:hypothetical protein